MNAKRQVAQYIISDLVSTNIGWLLFNIFRYYLLPINKEIASLSVYLSYHKIIEGQILFPVLFLCIFYLSGYYNQPFLKSRLEEFFTTLYSLLIGTLIIFFIAIINDLSYGPPAGAGGKAPGHSAHRPSFHSPSTGWEMGVL